MIESLPLFHRVSGQPVIVLGRGEAAEAKRRLVERAGGIVVDDIQNGIDQGARLAFVAHDNKEAEQGDAVRLRDAGLLVNVADRPDLCDFTVPSILDRSPVLVAVGTGGASAGLAKALRLRLEQLLPQSLGRLAAGLHAARERLRARWPEAADRRRALDAAMAEGGVLDPMRDGSADRVEALVEREAIHLPDQEAEIFLRGEDPEDLTLREARLLGSADCIAYEAAVATAVLERARADARRIALAKGAFPPPGAGLTVILRR